MLIDHFTEKDLMNYPDNQTAGEVYSRLKIESDNIAAALTELKEHILNDYKKDPNSLIGVSVTPTKGRSTVKWAEIADEMDIPEAVIAAHTKVGKSSYTVRIVAPEARTQKYY